MPLQRNQFHHDISGIAGKVPVYEISRRAGFPPLHGQPRAGGGQLQADPIFFRTSSIPVNWNVASWPRPWPSVTLIFSRAPSGSERRNPTASPL